MKTVTVECSYSIFCSAQVQVPDDFKFKSSASEERIDELKSILDVNFDALIPEPEVKDHESINDMSFDMWYDVDFD